jgi:hypothetical protein
MFLVDKLPQWLPGMGWKQVAEDYLVTTHDFLNVPYEYVLQQRVSNIGLLYMSNFNSRLSSIRPKERPVHLW